MRPGGETLLVRGAPPDPRASRSQRSAREGGHDMSSASPSTSTDHQTDAADLARFGYKQELKRGLGLFSSWAVAFSYISPSTGIFTLFALGLTTLGGFSSGRGRWWPSANSSSRSTSPR